MGNFSSTFQNFPRRRQYQRLDYYVYYKCAKCRQEKFDEYLRNPPEGTAEMLRLISTLQSDRIDDQRAELRPLNQGTMPGVRSLHTTKACPEDDFIEVLARVQGTRIEGQRTALPPPPPPNATPEETSDNASDDFFLTIMKAQAGRMDEQRASIPNKSQASLSKK